MYECAFDCRVQVNHLILNISQRPNSIVAHCINHANSKLHILPHSFMMMIMRHQLYLLNTNTTAQKGRNDPLEISQSYPAIKSTAITGVRSTTFFDTALQSNSTREKEACINVRNLLCAMNYVAPYRTDTPINISDDTRKKKTHISFQCNAHCTMPLRHSDTCDSHGKYV